jgi:hypothetical protein
MTEGHAGDDWEVVALAARAGLDVADPELSADLRKYDAVVRELMRPLLALSIPASVEPAVRFIPGRRARPTE